MHDVAMDQKKQEKGRIPEWPNGADCKSAGLYLRWFESIFSHQKPETNGSGFYFEKRSFRASREQWKLTYIAEAQPKKPEFQRNCGSSSVGRASAFQAEGRGFEPRLPLQLRQCSSGVERFLGKEEVVSSILTTGSAQFFCI